MVLYDDRTRAEIDLDALAGNLRILRGQVKHSTKVMAMVKADAYGHGAIPVAHELEQLGIDYIQGFYFSKPLPLPEFLAFIKKQECKRTLSISAAVPDPV